MPDLWEREQCLDPDRVEVDPDLDDDGYTNIEEYLNGTAATLVQRHGHGRSSRCF